MRAIKLVDASSVIRLVPWATLTCEWLAGSRELLVNTDMVVVGAPSAGGDLGSSMPAPGPRG